MAALSNFNMNDGTLLFNLATLGSKLCLHIWNYHIFLNGKIMFHYTELVDGDRMHCETHLKNNNSVLTRLLFASPQSEAPGEGEQRLN